MERLKELEVALSIKHAEVCEIYDNNVTHWLQMNPILQLSVGGSASITGPREKVRLRHTHLPHPLITPTHRIGALEEQLKEKEKIEKMLEEQTRGQESLLEELEEALAQVELTLSQRKQEVMII